MYDAEANAKAIERVRNKNNERVRRAYRFMLTSPEGRSFIHDLCETCHLYGRTRGLIDEGQRQIALAIRQQAIDLGFFDEWQLAEREAEDFKTESRNMLEQTEDKQNETY